MFLPQEPGCKSEQLLSEHNKQGEDDKEREREKGREREYNLPNLYHQDITGRRGTRVGGQWWEYVGNFMIVTHASQSIIIMTGNTTEAVRPSEAEWD